MSQLILLHLFILAACSLKVSAIADEDVSSAIVGGERATQAQFPYRVSFRKLTSMIFTVAVEAFSMIVNLSQPRIVSDTIYTDIIYSDTNAVALKLWRAALRPEQ